MAHIEDEIVDSEMASPVLALEAERRQAARTAHRRALTFGFIGLLGLILFRLTIVGEVLPIFLQVLSLVLAFAPAVILIAQSDRSQAHAAAAKKGADAEKEVSDFLEPLEQEGWRKWTNQAIPGFERLDIDLVLKSPSGKHYCVEIKSNFRRANDDTIQRRCRAQAAGLRKTLKSREFVTAIICFPDSPGAPEHSIERNHLFITPLSRLMPLLRELEQKEHKAVRDSRPRPRRRF